MKSEPTYPLTVLWPDGEKDVVDDEQDACCNLEWFDSDDSNDQVIVRDSEGRRVRLKIVALEIETCELQS